MNVILIAVISLGVIALVSAAILYVASKKFAVYEDPRIAQVAEVLPQANCGGCGYPGCSGFADACVKAGSLDGKLYNSSPDGYGSQYTYETEESEAFGKRFTGGAAYSMGVEGRHFTFGLTGRTGWTSWRRSEGFTNLEFEIGYKF